MAETAPRDVAEGATARRVHWFAPDRPVETGTVFVRPTGRDAVTVRAVDGERRPAHPARSDG